jgi:hypothetical protein
MTSYFFDSSSTNLEDYKKTLLENTIKSSTFKFLSEQNEIQNIDGNIDNMITYMTNNVVVLDKVPNDFRKTDQDIQIPIESKKMLISLGLTFIQSNNDALHKKHLQMEQLDTVQLSRRNPAFDGYYLYLKEYIKKLNELKEETIINTDKNTDPKSTYELSLEAKLKQLIQQNKYFIYDIYLNHYIQYVYLLFAISILNNTERLFKLNALQRKQISLLDKTEGLLKAIDNTNTNDRDKITSVITPIDNLLANLNTHRTDNQLNDKEQQRLSVGGNDGTNGINTIADKVIGQILEKHKYFFNVYRSTRDSMPLYFESINDMISGKLKEFTQLKEEIEKLSEVDIEIFNKVNAIFEKSKTKNELLEDYNIQNEKPLSTIIEKIQDINNNMSTNIRTVGNELTKSQSNQSNQSNQSGGFVRGTTMFPSNNYKINKKSILK